MTVIFEFFSLFYFFILLWGICLFWSVEKIKYKVSICKTKQTTTTKQPEFKAKKWSASHYRGKVTNKKNAEVLYDFFLKRTNMFPAAFHLYNTSKSLTNSLQQKDPIGSP